ncbi:tachylectin-related carbohydrate-binding protein [Micromonospora sp. NPDC093244]|uniref:tachylectin-related carbohydrate-binding protein n=1 Tax=Micromonospora sp. NPDC093244 TaxID=3155071 RepID=UPI003425E2EE
MPAGRRALAFAGALLIGGAGLVAPLPASPAQAATDAFSCTGSAAFFNSTTAGTLARREYSTPGRDGGVFTAASTVGPASWQTFGRLLGGPDGRVYGINSTGLNRYRWTGSAWETVDGKQSWNISTSFTGYATAAYRNKITVDQIGDFYAVDALGKLRWYRFDESTRTWTINARVIDTGWDRYNLIVAAAPGTLYARAADGKLYRHRFDPASQRWISRDRQVGSSGWQAFTKGLFSAGGDTLFGIQTDGDLFQYRYREDNMSWALTADQIGNGWAGFPNVFTTTNTCRQGAITGPALPATPVQQNAPLAITQAPAAGTALGTLEIAYSDNIGQLRHGRANPDAMASIQWSAVPGTDAYTGKPSLVSDAQNRVTIVAHETTSNVGSLTQKTPAMPDWNPWLALGGAMRSEPTAVRLSDDTRAVFALDAGGGLWHRRQDGTAGDLLPWTPLGGTGLTGAPVVVPGVEGTATVLLADAAGTLQAATYKAGALTSAWTGLGDAGFVDTPSVITLPGRRLMVVARHTDGTIRSQLQNTDGTWPGTWSAIGDAGITPVGSPTAVLSPNTGRVSVFTRTTGDTIHHSRQTAAGSATWGNWASATVPDETYPTDPTAFVYQNSGGTRLGFVSRTANGSVRLYDMDESAASSTTRSATAGDVSFTEREIPQPRD